MPEKRWLRLTSRHERDGTDAQRFDDMARALARRGDAPRTRQRLLGALVAAAGGLRLGAGGASAAKPACRPEGGACKNDRQCCGGTYAELDHDSTPSRRHLDQIAGAAGTLE